MTHVTIERAKAQRIADAFEDLKKNHGMVYVEELVDINQALAEPILSAGPITPEMANWSEADKAKLVSVITQHAAPVQEPLTVKLKDDWRTDDWGKPIIYDTDKVDEVTGALTGDEGEEDSLTVLNSMVRYVSNVWPGKTALQVLIECEEAMIATPPAAQRQWVDLTDRQIESIFLDAGWSWGEKADMYVPAVREVLKLFKEINE